MKTAVVTWDLPIARTSGNALDISEIAGIDISLSADLGVTFVLLGTLLATDLQERIIPDLVDGDYVVRLVVNLVTGEQSAGVDTPFLIDTSAPNNVTNVLVSLSP